MIRFRRLRLSGQSLFMKIFVSFLSIILLFALFNAFTFAFFTKNVQREIIDTNRQLLADSSERFGTQFARVQTMLHNLYVDKDVAGFARQLRRAQGLDVNYLQAVDALKAIRKEAYNPLFYLEAIVIYYESGSLTLDQEGSSSAEDLFGRAYASGEYPLSFWNGLAASANAFRFLPAARYNSSDELPGGGELLPLSFKEQGSDYRVIALIDIEKARNEFFGETAARSVAIVNGDGTVLYRSPDAARETPLPALDGDSGYKLKDGFYYFWEKDGNGLRYVTSVPYESIAVQVRKLSWVLLLVAALSIAIGLAASYAFSNRLQRPVKHILSAMTNPGHARPGKSKIKEFDLIERNIRRLMAEKDAVENEMKRQSSILTTYGYMNKLKSIHTDINEWKDFLETGESYTVVLYELRFRSAALAAAGISADRAARAIREHVQLICSETFPDSHTFQMEKHQILSVIKGKNRDGLADMLRRLKDVLDRESGYCLVTAAASSRFEHTSQFNHAYTQVLAMTRQALLIEETQIIWGSGRPFVPPVLDPARRKELETALEAGRAEAAMPMLIEFLEKLHEQEASIEHFRHFADDIVGRITDSLRQKRIDDQALWPLKPITRQLGECCSLEEYKDAFQRLLWHAAELYCSMPEEEEEADDPIVSRFLQLLESRYAEELSLDYLADRLNMSSSYLSAYIKEKTGTNYSEHLNNIRMRRAQELLVGTSTSIADIGRQVGYQNITSFNRMFKKWTGVSPSEYRRRHAPMEKSGA